MLVFFLDEIKYRQNVHESLVGLKDFIGKLKNKIKEAWRKRRAIDRNQKDLANKSTLGFGKDSPLRSSKKTHRGNKCKCTTKKPCSTTCQEPMWIPEPINECPETTCRETTPPCPEPTPPCPEPTPPCPEPTPPCPEPTLPCPELPFPPCPKPTLPCPEPTPPCPEPTPPCPEPTPPCLNQLKPLRVSPHRRISIQPTFFPSLAFDDLEQDRVIAKSPHPTQKATPLPDIEDLQEVYFDEMKDLNDYLLRAIHKLNQLRNKRNETEDNKTP